ncbi:phosphate/phosphite/phosphonate ABC transporter substrate-binding protein [Mesorhizobium sp. A623]
MSEFLAALPMYDWPEVVGETDAQWVRLRDGLRRGGIDAPEKLVRRNADMSPVPGGIRDASGPPLAPDPATLPPDELDFHALWTHPALLFTQTCWGPLGQGLERHVRVIGQPDYSAFEGGQGALYSSAVVMRRGEPSLAGVSPPSDGEAVLPLSLLRGRRLAFNSTDSMSGILALTRDLEAMGETLDIFAERIESGGHRASIVAVAEGRADVATIDCRSLALAQRFDPAARYVQIVGWTARCKGLPFITARTTPVETIGSLRKALSAAGMLAD